MNIRVGKQREAYKLLFTLEFNSDRKRMTVILEKNGEILVLTKGADNIMEKRIKGATYSQKT